VTWAKLESWSEEARELRAQLAGRSSPASGVARDAQEVGALRIGPLLEALEGVDELLVIPSGQVSKVPVEALRDADGVPFADRFTISYIPSATIYTWLEEGRSRRRRDDPALLVGDPPFTEEQRLAMEQSTGTLLAVADMPDTVVLRSALAGNEEALESLPRLPGTRDEVGVIATLAPSSTLLLGPDASEQEIVRLAESGRLSSFRTLHLATHALVDDERPENSSLILSRVDLPNPLQAAMDGSRIYDGVLTAKEILREWKLDADLVTLSACETGLGKEIAGEGMVGFAHAFLQAGARSLLVSLWKVDDVATSLLMQRFYENWWRRDMPKAKALQEAKRWLREWKDESGATPFAHPYYWSAFILIGDPH
jgi:CHAT domain-containing protein